MEARLEKDHFALERWCSHFNSSMAISAVQIWISSAFRLVPTKLFTFKSRSRNRVLTVAARPHWYCPRAPRHLGVNDGGPINDNEARTLGARGGDRHVVGRRASSDPEL